MKKFNKTLLAAALMVAAGSANASTFANGATDGSNEAFLVAFDAGYVNTDGTLGRTYNLDLGTTFKAMQTNVGSALAAYAGAGKDLSTDVNWTAFRTGGTNLISYAVAAVGDTSSQANNGVFVTGVAPTAPLATAGTTPAGSTLTWGTVITAVNKHAAEINTGLTGSSSVIKGTDAASSGQANSVPTFDTLWGSGFGISATAAYGSSDSLWNGETHLGSITKRGTTTNGVALLAQSDITNVGAFTLAGNTLSFAPVAVSHVPLPAAVWMFGAGLMGMLRLNRRKSVQA